MKWSHYQPGRTCSLRQLSSSSVCSCTHRRWSSSWCWSQYRCHHDHISLNNLSVKMLTWFHLPDPKHRAVGRSAFSLAVCTISLELSLELTSQELSVQQQPPTSAASDSEPTCYPPSCCLLYPAKYSCKMPTAKTTQNEQIHSPLWSKAE